MDNTDQAISPFDLYFQPGECDFNFDPAASAFPMEPSRFIFDHGPSSPPKPALDFSAMPDMALDTQIPYEGQFLQDPQADPLLYFDPTQFLEHEGTFMQDYLEPIAGTPFVESPEPLEMPCEQEYEVQLLQLQVAEMQEQLLDGQRVMCDMRDTICDLRDSVFAMKKYLGELPKWMHSITAVVKDSINMPIKEKSASASLAQGLEGIDVPELRRGD